MAGSIARIDVARDVCIGSACCVEAAPGVFQLDDSCVSTVSNPDGGTETEIFEAAETCPTLAISLYDGAGVRLFPR
jgi:ferredoxin